MEEKKSPRSEKGIKNKSRFLRRPKEKKKRKKKRKEKTKLESALFCLPFFIFFSIFFYFSFLFSFFCFSTFVSYLSSFRKTREKERSPRNSARRVEPSPRSKSKKVLSLSSGTRRTSWTIEGDGQKKRTTKSADFPTDELRKSRGRRVSEEGLLSEDEGGEQITPRRRLLQSGKITTPRKSFWEELGLF